MEYMAGSHVAQSAQVLEIPMLVELEEDTHDELSAIVHGLYESQPDATAMLRATLHQRR